MLRWRNLSRSFQKALRDPGYAAHVFRRRFASWRHYSFGNGTAPYPETISLFLTHRCNLRCKMCGQWGENGWARLLPPEQVAQGLPFDAVVRLLDDVAPGKPAITLFGGEPLLHPEWPEIVSEIKKRGMRVNIITNGTLLEQHAGEVVDRGVDELIFSLDGPEEVHDEMRSGTGIFRRAVSAFQKVREYRRAKGVSHPRINISTTIFETNYRRLGEVIETAESIGADTITFHHLIFVSHGMCAANSEAFRNLFGLECSDWTGFARETPPDIDPDYLIAELMELRRRKSSVAVTVYPNFTDDEIRRYYRDLEFTPVSYADRCISPWTTAYVFPNGDVKPCLDTCFVAGNILTEQFRDVWNGETIGTYRRALRECGSFPACKRCTELYRA